MQFTLGIKLLVVLEQSQALEPVPSEISDLPLLRQLLINEIEGIVQDKRRRNRAHDRAYKDNDSKDHAGIQQLTGLYTARLRRSTRLRKGRRDLLKLASYPADEPKCHENPHMYLAFRSPFFLFRLGEDSSVSYNLLHPGWSELPSAAACLDWADETGSRNCAVSNFGLRSIGVEGAVRERHAFRRYPYSRLAIARQ